MTKILEDLLAEDIAQSIDITWDGHTIEFWHNVELECELFADVRGTVDYTYEYEEDTNALIMTWCSVDIESLDVQQYKDGEPTTTPHLNEVFVKKYLEQYLMSKS